jgi:hypothetical protein
VDHQQVLVDQVRGYQRRYPAAVACLLDTLPELTVFLRFPLLLCQAAAA